MKILVSDSLSKQGVEVLEKAGFTVVVKTKLPKEELLKEIADADGLIVRSGTKVTAEVIAAAGRLKVVGRAGSGLDNVDTPAATRRGIVVMNTPGGNTVTTAEHTMAMIFSMSRRIPQATASTKSGKWEKKKFLGSELRGKTLGIVGLGSIGREVVKRARSFEMRILAHDPYVTSQIARDLNVELVALPGLYAQSDYITLHVSLTPETEGLLSREAFDQMKPGVRIVNCARGELIDDAALREAMESGKVAGAALDAFHVEPTPPGFPLFALDSVLATPHIAGSTEEAQEIVGVRIAEQVVEYLNSGVAINAVNMPALSPEQYRALGPYISLAEKLGSFAAHIATGNPKTLRLVYHGKIADSNTNLSPGSPRALRLGIAARL